MQQTLILLKPDAVQRRLVGRILGRFEDKGIKLAGLKMLQVTKANAQRLYDVHKGKDFYAELVNFIISGPVVAAVLEGNDVIAVVRRMIGPTFGPDGPGGTIRGDFGLSRRFNVIHGSDSPKAAAREISIFFPKRELVRYSDALTPWIYANQQGRLI